ncbi:UNVERIFIED_CONTAM: hypothetical protein QOZ12_28995, partial [Pseudomonas aeruginosa]
IPLAMFGVVWIGFSAAAWICARKRDLVNHRRFVIRSLAVALAFVWVRAIGAVGEPMLGFISNQEARDTSQEYLSFL